MWKEIDLSRADANQLRRARQETDIIALLRHPNVIDVYNDYVDGNRLLIETEFCEGEKETSTSAPLGSQALFYSISLSQVTILDKGYALKGNRSTKRSAFFSLSLVLKSDEAISPPRVFFSFPARSMDVLSVGFGCEIYS